MEDTDYDNPFFLRPVFLGKVEDQIVAVGKVSQIGSKVGPLGCDPRIKREKAELLIKIIAELSGCSGVIRRNVSDDAFQVFQGNALEAKRRHYALRS